jgi:hypothetical protein
LKYDRDLHEFAVVFEFDFLFGLHIEYY